jgi:hypothetical protein
MDNCGPLAWYGMLVILTMMGFVAVPYWRGRSDLATAWNTLLCGIAIYTGLGCLEAAFDPSIAFKQLDWFQPSSSEVQRYMIDVTVFIVALLGFYYFDFFGRRVAGRSLRLWPPTTPNLFVFVLFACAVMIALSFVTGGITFIGPTVNNLARKASIVAVVFAFVLWYRRPANVALLFAFMGVFCLACIYAMMIFLGRRMLLAVGLGPVLVLYWMTLRNWRPGKCLLAIGICGAILFVGSAAYSSFRHFHRTSDDGARTASGVIEQLKTLDVNRIANMIASNQLRFFAQSNVKYSLLVQKAIALELVETEPANTLYFLASYPVPRRLWGEKPMTIGRRIGHYILELPQTTNFGVGIGGHGAFEGGPIIMVVYAYLIAFLIRLIDIPLQRQPTNPFLISLLAAAMPHVLALPRGDFGVMGIETIICFVYIVPLAFVGRMLFGTVRPTTIWNGASEYSVRGSQIVPR